MKIFYTLAFTLFINLTTSLAQTGNVGIGTNSPDNSSILDISSGNKGLLVPRVSLSATNSSSPITSPAISLLVYNTNTGGTAPYTVTPGYYYWDGNNWIRLVNTGNIRANNGLSVTNDTVQLGGTLIKNTIIQNNGNNFAIDGSGNVGIGYSTPGNKLTVNGTIESVDFGAAGSKNILIGDDSYFTDIDEVNMTGLYGNADNTIGGIRLGNSSSAYLFGKSNNIGISTKTPLNKLHIIHTSNTDGLLLQNTAGGSGATSNIFMATYADITAGTSRPGIKISAIDDGNYSAHLSFGTKTPGADANAMVEKMRITSEGAAIGTSFTYSGLNYKSVLGTGDNKWYSLMLDNNYGLTNISIYANSRFDGNIGINGLPLNGLLDNGSASWYYQNGQSTSFQSSDNGNADNAYHYALCPNNSIATGVEMYATGSYIDHSLHIRCTNLKAGYVTTNNGTSTMTMMHPTSPNSTVSLTIGGVPSAIIGPYDNDRDDQYHIAACPPGTFVRGIYIYSTDQFDGGMFFTCTGIRSN